MGSSRLALGATVAAALYAQGSAFAADPLLASQPVPSPGYIVTLTANAQASPLYPGSDELTAVVYPSVSFRRAGEARRFSAPDDGLSLSLSESPALRFGIVGRYRGGRYFGDNRRLIGLDDVKWAIEPGAFVEVWPTEFLRMRAELRRGFNGHEGFVADLALDAVIRAGAFTVSAGPRVSLGDQEFTRTYFGVRPYEAALNGQLQPYRPSGGVTSAGALAALTYDWSQSWSTTGYVSYQRLLGDAADSPIVQRFGSKDQFGFGASVSYSFAVGGF